LKFIEIAGVDFASYECTNCINSFSSFGAKDCIECDSNTYYSKETGNCVNCPKGTFSHPNSIKKEDCISLPKCTEYDYNSVYSVCKNGIRQVSYEWNNPVLCNNEHALLPKNSTENCEKCEKGQYLDKNMQDETESCKFCKSGLYNILYLICIKLHST